MFFLIYRPLIEIMIVANKKSKTANNHFDIDARRKFKENIGTLNHLHHHLDTNNKKIFILVQHSSRLINDKTLNDTQSGELQTKHRN